VPTAASTGKARHPHQGWNTILAAEDNPDFILTSSSAPLHLQGEKVQGTSPPPPHLHPLLGDEAEQRMEVGSTLPAA